VHTGIAQASSSMELVGNTYGIANSGNTALQYLNVTVALTAGGTPVDLSAMVVSYNDNNGGHNPNLTYDGLAPNGDTCSALTTADHWCISDKINNVTPSAVLENNAQMIISIGMPSTATPNTKISINFQPAVGAVLPLIRTVPGGLVTVQPIY
jgi:archaeal flagellin FlaB